MSPKKDLQYVSIFSALADPVRLRILRHIASAEEMPCTTLRQKVSISKSTVSYHIKILAQARLIIVRKEGRNFFYTLRRDQIETLLPDFVRSVLIAG